MKRQGEGLSRRSFLKNGAAAILGTAAAPMVFPSTAWGAAGRAAASERITLGFIGLGKLGLWAHLHGFLNNPGAQVVAVCDVEHGRLMQSKAIAEKFYADQGGGSYRGCDVYSDFRELLARDDIDAVVIATPDHWHAATTVAAAKAGKDIYCEKPLSHDIAEGRAMVEAVRRHGRVCQTGSQQRSEYNGYFRRAVELVQGGAIGELTSIDVGVGGMPAMDFDLKAEPVPEGLDWDMWLGPAPWRPYSSVLCPPSDFGGWPHWRYYQDFGNGGFSDMGAHHFDIAQWAVAMDDSGPVEITPPDGRDVKQLTYRYANGVMMYVGGSADNTFHGTEGTIYVSRDFIRSEPAGILETNLQSDAPHYNRGCDHREDWLRCIRSRQRPIADVEIGHRSATVCHLGVMACRLERSLHWDPAAERFENDDEANRLRSRPMRSSWHL